MVSFKYLTTSRQHFQKILSVQKIQNNIPLKISNNYPKQIQAERFLCKQFNSPKMRRPHEDLNKQLGTRTAAALVDFSLATCTTENSEQMHYE